MNYFQKRKLLKDIKKSQLSYDVAKIITHYKILELDSYNEVVERIKKIEDVNILNYISKIINLSISNNIFESIILNVIELESNQKIKLCYDLISEVRGDSQYLQYVYMYFFKINDINKLGYYVDYLLRNHELQNSDYMTIIPRIFCLDQIDRINTICSLFIRYGNTYSNYNNFILNKIFLIENVQKLDILGHFMMENMDLPDYEDIINKLGEIEDIKLLEEMCCILEDDYFKQSAYFKYIFLQLFNISDPIRLKLIGKIILDYNLMNLSNFKEIINKIFSIENFHILEDIIVVLDDNIFSNSKQIKQIFTRMLKIKNPTVFHDFTESILLLKSEKYIEHLCNLDSQDEHFGTVIKTINRILKLFELEINLDKKSILNIIFIRIFSLSDCKMMIPCLEELESMVLSNLRDKAIEKNTFNVSVAIDEKIEDAKRRNFIKENKEA